MFLRLIIVVVCLNSCTFSKPKQEEQKKLPVSENHSKITSHTLKNANGVRVEILNLGGIIKSIKTPNKHGVLEDVVLGFDTAADYLKPHPYFGAIAGRYANRIDNGTFTLDNKTYTLAQNNGSNHLHGGIVGFDKVFWDVSPFESEDGVGVRLHYLSEDMEEGYPGNLDVTVTYTLTHDNTLKVGYKATTDKKTILNLTQHSYFNLSGDFSNDILDHELQINASQYLPLNQNQIPVGTLEKVKNTPFDFQNPKPIGKDIAVENAQLEIGKGYDHCWVFDSKGLSKVARVYHAESGRLMEVYTDQPGMQLYTANFLDGTIPSKTGGFYKARSGFCLETQQFPNAPNQVEFPSTILNPNEIFTSETWFKFHVKKQD